MKYDNDNQPLTFIQLGLPAALVINRLRNAQTLRELARNEENPEKDKDDSKPGDAGKSKTEDELEYVKHRLREIRSWERRISGQKD